MPVVTGIKLKSSNGSCFEVFLDGEYAFTLEGLDLSASSIRVGEELAFEEIEAFKNDAMQAKVYALAIRFIGVRPRSKWEVKGFLRRKGIADREVAMVLERLGRNGLLDDRAFVRAWVDGRNALRPRSRKKLEQELSAKGVERDVIAEALNQLMSSDDEVGLAVEVARKKGRLPQYQDRKKLEAYLGRQGYRFEVIKRALEQIADESAA